MGFGEESLRTWTNSEGKTIKASLNALEGDSVTLRLENGRTYTIPLATLSDGDRQHVETWQKAAETAAAWENHDLKLGKPSEPIVESSFDLEAAPTRKGGLIGPWKAGIGEWSVSDGVLIGNELPEDNHASSLTHTLEGSDLIITAQVRLGEATQIAFACRDTVPPNLHLGRLYITPDKIWIQKMTGIAGTTKAERLEVLETEIDPEEWLDVTIEIIGDRYRAKVGDEEIEAQHERFSDAKGILALVNTGQGANFREVKVWKATPQD